jgi:hypothetical protein
MGELQTESGSYSDGALKLRMCVACVFRKVLHVRCMRVVCVLHVCCMCVACVLHVCCMRVACALHACCMCVACALELCSETIMST